MPVVVLWTYIINGDALRASIQPWRPSAMARLGDLHSRAVRSPRPLGTQCPQCVRQRSHVRARWPARPGHNPPFEVPSEFQSPDSARCPVSGEQFDPHFDRGRPRPDVGRPPKSPRRTSGVPDIADPRERAAESRNPSTRADTPLLVNSVRLRRMTGRCPGCRS